MPICSENITQAIKLLGKDEVRRVYLSADKVEKLENKWKRKLIPLFEQFNAKVAAALHNTGQLPMDLDFTDFFMEQFIDVAHEAVKATKPPKLTTNAFRFAGRPPPAKLPDSLRQLQEMWDRWKHKGQAPARVKSLANRVKKAYLDKCQSVWETHTKDFRSGQSFNMHEAVKVIEKASDGSFARAKTIVTTETTNYYNQTRRKIYDQSDDVTHYLFLAIRDRRTTKWCKDRNGVVYKKGDQVTDDETPAIHWNCRSEMVPLSKYNPRHEKLIKDPSLQRSNRHPTALPTGWGDKDRAKKHK